MKLFLLFCFLFFVTISTLVFPASGKIAGVIKDAKTHEPLVGVNVLIEGTMMGAASSLNGYYVILNVAPGTYTLRVSMIGYATVTIKDVVVNINETTNINVALQEKTIQTEQVVVIAKTPIIRRGVAASTININAKEISNLPVTSLSSVVGLQAGIQSSANGLIVRGGGTNQTGLMVNGLMLRNERTNNPFTDISYTSIKEIQIQTGGFSAKYGDIRSGLINIVTKSGSKSKYTFSMLSEYRSPYPKHFGISPNSPYSYWVRPYVNSPVAFYGTDATNPATGLSYWGDQYAAQYPQMYQLYQNGTLSKAQYKEILNAFAKQYPDFEGWIAYSNKLLNGNNPNNDLSPEAARKLFLFQHRRNLNIINPDYVVDASFGGPVPIVSKSLGNLRFFASYRRTRHEYVIPLSEPGVNNYTGQLKLTANVGEGERLMVQGMVAQTLGTNNNNAGLPGIFSATSSSSIANALNRVSYIDARMFAPNYWAPSRINYSAFSGKFTDVLNSSTFYEIQVSQFTSKYHTDPAAFRDTSRIYKFGNNFYTDDAPVGFWEYPSTAIGGMRMSVGFSNSRDSSVVSYYQVKADLQSQIGEHNQVGSGVSFTYTDNNVNYASVDKYLPSGRSRSVWHTFP
ncbi:MAG TPA: PEGA domain-containing protein, partial [Ignavibacteria bacterium]|nr:PEGA domain-containing protein [Ignavibacteria bacterium]